LTSEFDLFYVFHQPSNSTMDSRMREPVMAIKPLTLAERVQSLPPELFNKIYDEVFTPTNPEVVEIREDHRPPKSTQCRCSVSRQVRPRILFRDNIRFHLDVLDCNMAQFSQQRSFHACEGCSVTWVFCNVQSTRPTYLGWDSCYVLQDVRFCRSIIPPSEASQKG
jgi:hypothetical protein